MLKRILMKLCLPLLLILFAQFNTSAKSGQVMEIIDMSSGFVLDEWKSPGMYSPLNIFDNDKNTCFSTSSLYNISDAIASIDYKFSLESAVYIDEVRIMNGNAKSVDLYSMYNRMKDIRVTLENFRTGQSLEEVFVLEDKPGFQSHRFKTAYMTTDIHISNDFNSSPSDKIYKGTGHNNTCISEVEFYYKGEKIQVYEIKKLKEKYIKDLEAKIRDAFSGQAYVVRYIDGSRDIYFAFVNCSGDGTIRYSAFDEHEPMHDKFLKCEITDYLPDMWRVKDSMLYMRYKGTWMLYDYKINKYQGEPAEIYLFKIPFEGLPENSYFYFWSATSAVH